MSSDNNNNKIWKKADPIILAMREQLADAGVEFKTTQEAELGFYNIIKKFFEVVMVDSVSLQAAFQAKPELHQEYVTKREQRIKRSEAGKKASLTRKAAEKARKINEQQNMQAEKRKEMIARHRQHLMYQLNVQKENIELYLSVVEGNIAKCRERLAAIDGDKTEIEEGKWDDEWYKLNTQVQYNKQTGIVEEFKTDN